MVSHLLIPSLYVVFGGVFGVLLRFLIVSATHHWLTAVYFVGTIAVNVAGSVLVGGFLALSEKFHIDNPLKWFVVTGFLGGLTTFSSFILDGYKLYETKGATAATAYCATTFVLSVLGFLLAHKAVKYFF